MKDDGGPAFPCPPELMAVGGDGLSARDYFAGQALEGLCAHLGYFVRANHWTQDDETAKTRTDFAYRLADAMLEARKK